MLKFRDQATNYCLKSKSSGIGFKPLLSACCTPRTLLHSLIAIANEIKGRENKRPNSEVRNTGYIGQEKVNVWLCLHNMLNWIKGDLACWENIRSASSYRGFIQQPWNLN